MPGCEAPQPILCLAEIADAPCQIGIQPVNGVPELLVCSGQ
jgi:hypothetical protein